MLKGGVLVLLLIGSIKLLPKLNCIAPCGCDFIMFNPLAVWQGGETLAEGHYARTIVHVASTRYSRVRHVEYILAKITP